MNTEDRKSMFFRLAASGHVIGRGMKIVSHPMRFFVNIRLVKSDELAKFAELAQIGDRLLPGYLCNWSFSDCCF